MDHLPEPGNKNPFASGRWNMARPWPAVTVHFFQLLLVVIGHEAQVKEGTQANEMPLALRRTSGTLAVRAVALGGYC